MPVKHSVLNTYINRYKVTITVAFLCKIIEAILELFIPIVVALIIDRGILKDDKNEIIYYTFILFALAIIGYLFALVCQYFAAKCSQEIATDMRRDLFVHINKLRPTSAAKIQTSSLINRVTSDVLLVQQCIAMTIRLASRLPFLIIGSLVACYIVSDSLFYIFIIVTILLAAVIIIITIHSINRYQKAQVTLDRIVGMIKETLQGIRAIKVFNTSENEISKFDAIVDTKNKQLIQIGKIQAILQPFAYMIVNIAALFVVYHGAYNVSSGHMSSGDIVALVNYLTQISLALFVLVNILTLYFKSYTSITRINEVFSLETMIEPTKNDTNSSNYALELQNVSFGYGDKLILEDISFQVLSKSKLAIIGTTGCGKTTLVDLLMKKYSLNTGNIKIYGKDSTKLTSKILYNNISLVSQKTMLIAGTIEENLKVANQHATKEEMIKALKDSQSYDFVCKKGFDYHIEEYGRNLSGGQIQRIMIARALLKKSKIIIFDESFSALDNITTNKIHGALAKMDITCILITKRIMVAKNADNIVVLEDGKIDGIGTHESLKKRSNLYQELCALQIDEVYYE